MDQIFLVERGKVTW